MLVTSYPRTGRFGDFCVKSYIAVGKIVLA